MVYIQKLQAPVYTMPVENAHEIITGLLLKVY